MARPSDDDALSWGDDDPTLDAGRASARAASPGGSGQGAADVDAAEPALPEGFTAVGKGSERVGVVESDGTVRPAGSPTPMGNVELVSLGVLGGVYLLLAIGWWIGGSRLQLIARVFLEPIGFTASWIIAVLAAPIWFVTVFLLTRGRPAWVRVLLLVVGAIVLLPWPFLMTGVG